MGQRRSLNIALFYRRYNGPFKEHVGGVSACGHTGTCVITHTHTHMRHNRYHPSFEVARIHRCPSLFETDTFLLLLFFFNFYSKGISWCGRCRFLSRAETLRRDAVDAGRRGIDHRGIPALGVSGMFKCAVFPIGRSVFALVAPRCPVGLFVNR